MTAEVEPSRSEPAPSPGLSDLFLHFMLISAVAVAYWTRLNPLWAFGVAAIVSIAGFS